MSSFFNWIDTLTWAQWAMFVLSEIFVVIACFMIIDIFVERLKK